MKCRGARDVGGCGFSWYPDAASTCPRLGPALGGVGSSRNNVRRDAFSAQGTLQQPVGEVRCSFHPRKHRPSSRKPPRNSSHGENERERRKLVERPTERDGKAQGSAEREHRANEGTTRSPRKDNASRSGTQRGSEGCKVAASRDAG